MSKSAARRTSKKPYWNMNADELARATKKLVGVRFEETRPLSPDERAKWRRARKPGRPRVGKGAQRVFVSLEGDLLERVDAHARELGVGRSRLIALALAQLLPTADEGATGPRAGKGGAAEPPGWAKLRRFLEKQNDDLIRVLRRQGAA